MCEESNCLQTKKPNYWELLTEEDKVRYLELQKKFSSSEYKNRRNKSKETFQTLIDQIKSFVVRDDGNIIQRSLVCGIVWLDHGIAINTHQLCLLTDKCKSSINGSFQLIGYGTVPVGAESSSDLINTFPFLKNNFPELRQWTIRQRVEPAPSLKIQEESPAPNGFEDNTEYMCETSTYDAPQVALTETNQDQSFSFSTNFEKYNQDVNESPEPLDDSFYDIDFDFFF
ncbi:potassium/sodium hyperpolarization-activated cyclic nucleotide-gated channel 1 [Histomonas meleagridis]|uniref:potassium/sodium hyperpolarization-activated cyclic nucleotide-gated channel 1 n=1 Tax=Histomonas meleagridis TaxID=135588 RepID=UPI00355A076D|nr:potassium/sodium hyperpolarization-activated cyclic nucleotide-gated channel 1 [Histomonas meleagridis]